MQDEALYLLVAAVGFILPVLASRWIWLVLITLPCLVPGFYLIVLGWQEQKESPWGGLTLFVGIIVALPVLLGAAARMLSLTAAGFGHMRPASLWIEVLAGIGALILLLGPTLGFG